MLCVMVVSFWADHVVSLLTVVKTLRPLVNISYSLIGIYYTWFKFHEIFERDQVNKLSLLKDDNNKHDNEVILNNVFAIILTIAK